MQTCAEPKIWNRRDREDAIGTAYSFPGKLRRWKQEQKGEKKATPSVGEGIPTAIPNWGCEGCFEIFDSLVAAFGSSYLRRLASDVERSAPSLQTWVEMGVEGGFGKNKQRGTLTVSGVRTPYLEDIFFCLSLSKTVVAFDQTCVEVEAVSVNA